MSSTFNRFNDLNKGSVCALNLLHDTSQTLLFCSLNILLDLEPQTSMEYWIWGRVKLLYKILKICGKYHLSLKLQIFRYCLKFSGYVHSSPYVIDCLTKKIKFIYSFFRTPFINHMLPSLLTSSKDVILFHNMNGQTFTTLLTNLYQICKFTSSHHLIPPNKQC